MTLKRISHKWLLEHFRYEAGNLLMVKKYKYCRAHVGQSLGAAYGNNYKNASFKGRHYYVHRLVWFYFNGRWPEEVDHIDGDKFNNRIENLRECTHSQNHAKRPSPSSTGLRGVIRRRNKTEEDTYFALITVRGKPISLGTFKHKNEAAKAYNKAAKKYFGEFAWINVTV